MVIRSKALMNEHALFCVGQKVFIEKNGEVLVLGDPIEGLDFPGGRIEIGEARDGDAMSLSESLRREVREETALEIEVGRPFAVWYHEFPVASRFYGKVVYLVGFMCKYVSGNVILSDEHNKYDWVKESNCKSVDDGSDYFDVLLKYFETKRSYRTE